MDSLPGVTIVQMLRIWPRFLEDQRCEVVIVPDRSDTYNTLHSVAINEVKTSY